MYNGPSTSVANWYHSISPNVSFFGTASSGGQLQFVTGANANSVRIDASGRVGIGPSTSPSYNLVVNNSGEVISQTISSSTNGSSIVQAAVSGGPFIDFRAYGSTGVGTLMGISSVSASFILSGGPTSIGTYTNYALTLATNNVARVTLDTTGNVGIGTTAPGEKLEVSGNLKVTGTGNIDASGTITAFNIKAKYQDVAEWVESSEALPAGTVVVLDQTKSNQVVASSQSYDTRVAGVVSAQPGIALGESGDNKVLVSTTGRVRVKVDASKGPIHIGDLLVTSDVPGVAMKSDPIKVGGRLMHMPGTLIGKALEPLEKGSGKILVLLSLQ
jgi:hypothetical protein